MVEQGDAGDGMYIIVSGTAEVDVGGRFHKLTTGNFFGEMALVTAGKRMATVKAVETGRGAQDPGGRVPVVPAGAPRGRPVDAAGDRGTSPRGRAADRRVDGQLTGGSIPDRPGHDVHPPGSETFGRCADGKQA